ncbi:methionyl-tRNA formyltransferase [Knoellia sp. CPCC 206435]|uniref:methionyl-tRNA formyltransferase n=1 Tax=Knoellia terrae TaxID=3404797 RepID=UPI003B42D059
MGPTALTALESLAPQCNVVGLVRDLGTGDHDRAIAARAEELSVPIYQDVRLSAVEGLLDEAVTDCVVVSSYNRVLSRSLLGQRRFVNVHYAPLPRYRGRANVNWALINGEPEAAITIHSMHADLDAGNILYQETIPLTADDDASTVYARLNAIQRRELGPTVERFVDGFLGTPQDEAESTYGCARVDADGQISWAASTSEIHALIRALAPPYRPAHTHLDGHRIDIVRAAPSPIQRRFVGRVPGRVVERSASAGYVDVLTGDGILRLFEVTTSGETVSVSASSVITSTRQTLGLSVLDLLDRIVALEKRLGGEAVGS